MQNFQFEQHSIMITDQNPLHTYLYTRLLGMYKVNIQTIQYKPQYK